MWKRKGLLQYVLRSTIKYVYAKKIGECHWCFHYLPVPLLMRRFHNQVQRNKITSRSCTEQQLVQLAANSLPLLLAWPPCPTQSKATSPPPNHCCQPDIDRHQHQHQHAQRNATVVIQRPSQYSTTMSKTAQGWSTCGIGRHQ